MAPVDYTVQLFIDAAWVSIDSDVRVESGVTITAGRRSESSGFEPAQCVLAVRNTDGKYTPRNPSSVYYGKLGRNTPLRVLRTGGAPDVTGAGSVTAPDTANLSIVGDIDIRVDLHDVRWATGSSVVFLSKWTDTAQRSYRLGVSADGHPVLEWSADGAAVLTATGSAPLPVTAGRQALRATLDVDNGAAGNTTTFYTAPDMDGAWTQHGSTVVKAGVTSIFNSTAGVIIFSVADRSWYQAQIYQGIAGTRRANPTFTAQTSGATSFADGDGNTWTVPAGLLTNVRPRFWGEVSSLPLTWGPKEPVWATLTAAGVTRRLGQGTPPVFSALRYNIPTVASLAGYWPMEDLPGATAVGSAFAGDGQAQVIGALTFGALSEFVASRELPDVGAGRVVASVAAARNGSTAGTSGQVRFLMSLPSSPLVDGIALARIDYSTGAYVELTYSTFASGSIGASAYNSLGEFQVATGFTAGALGGAALLVSIETSTSGNVFALRILTTTGVSESVTTTCAFGSTPIRVTINPGAASQAGASFGHVHVQDAVTAVSTVELDANTGETAAARASRMSAALGVPFLPVGTATTSEPMGAQSVTDYLGLLADVENADLGLVGEPRSAASVRYRTRESLQSQHPAFTLAYSVFDRIEPDPDDLSVRNDVTAVREGGSSFRVQQTTGPLSVSPPPAGVGPYSDEVTVNIATDGQQLRDQASWRVHVGTVDEPRYPSVTVNLIKGSPVFTNTELLRLLTADVGDLLVITGLPAWVPPDQVEQVIVGYTEYLSDFHHRIDFTGVPASTFRVGRYDHPASRYDTLTSTINEDLTTTETDVGVATTGPVWTQAAGHMPFTVVIGGETMSVTAVTGATSPQVFTVTRSVNGVVKAHSSGAQVRLAAPVFYGL